MLVVNVPPVNSVPAAQSTLAATPLAFTAYRNNQISVIDPDASSNQIEVTLSADTGKLTLLNPDPNGGLTYSMGDGTEDATMKFVGTPIDINTALSWISYRPFGGITASVTQWPVSDGGNGHWYEYISTGRAWDAARNDAEARGGYLATVTSLAENTFLNALYPSSAAPWMGGYQDKTGSNYVEPTGGWRWVTGEAWSYTNWNSGEPNNGYGTEHYAQTGTKWNDAAGSNTLPYLVEYDADPRIAYTGAATLTITTNDMGDVGVGGPLTVTNTVPIAINAVPAFAPSPSYTTFPWVLDDTFGTGGKQALSITAGVDYINEMKVLPDGKVLAVGAVNDRFAIMKFNTDLTLDETFGEGGGRQMDFGAGLHAKSFVIDSQGRIIVVGGNRVVRFTSAGAVDTTFGTSGVAVTDHVGHCYAVKIQADGRVVVVGRDNNYFRLTRYTSAGVADANWQYDAGGDGGDWGRDVIIREDGDILLVGRGWAGGYWNGSEYAAFSVVRIDANGTYEAQYWAGLGNDEFVNSAVPLPDGKFLLIGRADGDVAVTRHFATGELDTRFGTNGIVKVPVLNSTDEGYRATLAPDGKIIITGFANNGVDQDIIAVKLNPDGSLDTSFNTTGKVSVGFGSNDYGYSVAALDDGKILIAGRTGNDIAFVKLLGDSNQSSRLANRPPVNVVPGAQTTLVDTAMAFTAYRGNQISISDPDAALNHAKVTLGVTSGTLTLLNPDPSGGLTYVTGDGTQDASMSFTGTVADINTALAWISYQPPVNEFFQWSSAVGGNDHWYQYVATTKTWDLAKADAETRGGYLATVTNSGENDFVNSLYAPSVAPWLGGYQNRSALNYSEPNGAWRWVTGETWSYTNWNAGQPDDSSNAEHYLQGNVSSTKKWNDANGAGALPYVVEYNTDPRPTAVRSATVTITTEDLGNVGIGGPRTDTDTVPIAINAVPAFAPSPSYTTFPWVLDDTFGTGGKQALSITAGVDYINEMKVLPDGKVLAVGAVNDRFAIMKFNTDLTLDETFGEGGGRQMDFGAGLHAKSFVIDSQGRIIVVGGNRVVRFTSAGAVDTTFGTSGVAVTDHVGHCYAVKIQADGRVVVVGRDNNYFRLTRYTSAGVADANWQYDAGGDGGDWGRDVIIREDGDILLVGRGWAGGYWNGSEYAAFSVVRIDANGTYEAQYWAGLGNDEFVNSAVPLPDGKFLLIGRADGDVAVTRHFATGELDTRFGTNGIVKVPVLNSTDEGYRATLAPDGKIIITGFANNGVDQDIIAVKLNPDGSLDTSFNTTGKVSVGFGSNDYGYSVAALDDGKILIAGRTGNDIAFVKLLGDSNSFGLANTVGSIPENSSTATRTKVADIVIPDNILTGATITLSGADAAQFEVAGKAIYLKAGVTLDYEAQDSYSILITFTGGIFDVRGPLTVPYSLAVGDVFETISLDVASGQTATHASTLVGTSKYVKTGPGILVLDKANTHNGGTDVEQGELVVRNVAALGAGPLHVKSGALVTFDVGSSGLAITSIIVDAGGKVDVGYGRFTLAAGSHSITEVRSLLQAGRGNGDWGGAYGITSRFASALEGLGVGYMSNSDGTTTIGFAASGDTNLDKVIDLLDIANLIGSGKFDQGLPAEWDEGDSNYDGVLDALDLSELLASNRYDKGTYVPAPQAASANSLAADDNGFLSPLQAAFAALAASVSSESPPVRRTRTAIR
jgi:uncharacterized delta-60 repeat protein